MIDVVLGRSTSGANLPDLLLEPSMSYHWGDLWCGSATTTYFFSLVRCAINSIADPMSPPNVSHITSVYVAPRLGTKLW